MPDPQSPLPPAAVDGTVLAWQLAAVARPHISTDQAHRIHIAIGTGETFEAIDTLITVIARQQLCLDARMHACTNAWLDRYVGQPAIPRLRALLVGIRLINSETQS